MFRKLSIIVLVLSIFLVPMVVSAQDDVSVRAVWTQDIMVIINISDSGADLSELTLTSANGEITPENWIMAVDEETTVPYSLTNVAAGDCLIVYFAGAEEEPEIPASVECGNVVGEFTPTTYGDLVWDVTQGGFSASTGVECDVTSGTSCDISVGAGHEAMMGDEEVPEEVASRVLWNQDILVVINTSEYGADWSGLGFTSESGGEIAAGSWVMAVDEETTEPYALGNARPGSCLISYLGGTEEPDLPENVECTQVVGEFTPENIEDIVWDVNAGGFSATTGDACDPTSGTSCDLTVPVSPVELDMELEEMEMDMGANLRAIWTEDIFVLINVSDAGADLTGLNLTSADGAINAEDWVLLDDEEGGVYTLDDVRPGSCLISYPADMDMPDLPENVECTRTIAEFTPVNLTDIIWNVNSGGFNASSGAECGVEMHTSCDIEAPVTE